MHIHAHIHTHMYTHTLHTHTMHAHTHTAPPEAVSPPAPSEPEVPVPDDKVLSPEVPDRRSMPPPPATVESTGGGTEDTEEADVTPQVPQTDTGDETDGVDAKPLEMITTTITESVDVDTQILDVDDSFAELVQILVDVFVR